jgi:tetratricopeptide (TPR) repeat protein
MRGQLLLTTRALALGRLAHRIEVNALDQNAAALLVLHRAGLLALDASLAQAEPADRQLAEELSRQLGSLPLALDQAGAYLEETGCSLQHYLDLYKSHRAELLRHRGGLALDHPDSVATTWSLSFASIERRSVLAADLLRVCSLLHPDAIPEELFLDGAVHLGPALVVVEADPLAFNNALAVIQNYSLLRRSSREQTLSMHRVVQAVLADAMTNHERGQWTERVIAALNALFPDVSQHGWAQWKQCGRLLPHVLTIAEDSAMQQLELASLLTKTADYLLQRAQYQQAETLYLRALSMHEQMLGNEHPQVAFPLNGLADLYREQGQYEQAEPLYQRALCLWEQTPGSQEFEIPSPLNNLAILYQEQGRYEQAEQLLLRDLALDEQRFGPEHAKIAIPLNNLAILYLQQGHYEQAEQLLQRALRLDERTFGPEHPEVAFSLNNLADLYRKQGQYEQAEPLYLRALHIREQTLGSEHPQVAYPLNDLATLYREQGQYEQAEQLYRRALTIRQQQRGASHPETAETLHDLARLQELRNQLDQACALYQQALAIREQRLGPEHSQTLDTSARYSHLRRGMEIA